MSDKKDAHGLLFDAFMSLLNRCEAEYVAARKETMDTDSAQQAFFEDIAMPLFKTFLFSDRPLTPDEIEYGKSLADRVRAALERNEP